MVLGIINTDIIKYNIDNCAGITVFRHIYKIFKTSACCDKLVRFTSKDICNIRINFIKLSRKILCNVSICLVSTCSLVVILIHNPDITMSSHSTQSCRLSGVLVHSFVAVYVNFFCSTDSSADLCCRSKSCTGHCTGSTCYLFD